MRIFIRFHFFPLVPKRFALDPFENGFSFPGQSDEDDLFENIQDYLDGHKKQFKEERENSEKIIKELTERVEMLEVENAQLRKSCNSAVRPMDMEDSEEEMDTSDPSGRIVFF